MRIGIIGAGMIGGTLARRLVALGHDVVLANSRGPDTLRGLAGEIGARPVTATEAARGGEIVIVTIPERAVLDLPKDLFDGVSSDVLVIDTGNYYPVRDNRIAAIENGQVESEWVSEHLGRPVIKAFNNIGFKSLLENGRPKGAAGRVLDASSGRGASRPLRGARGQPAPPTPVSGRRSGAERDRRRIHGDRSARQEGRAGQPVHRRLDGPSDQLDHAEPAGRGRGGRH